MSKNLDQLTKVTTAEGKDLVHVLDKSANQDVAMKRADFFNSKPYGSMYMYNNGNLTTISALDTWYNVTNGAPSTSAGLINKFSHVGSAGSLTYNGDEPIIVKIDMSGDFWTPSGNSQLKCAIFKNGVILKEIQFSEQSTSTFTSPRGGASSGLVSLTNGDVITMHVKNVGFNYDTSFNNLSVAISQI